jgi:hypothetical protein
MKASLVNTTNGQRVSASILPPGNVPLPSLTDGWRFNFRKHSRSPGVQTYVIICAETPVIIEGCLIFMMRDQVEPYMSYVDISPHNQGENSQYDHVAECLIAFACKLSFINGSGAYKGWLVFDVLEENKENEIRPMTLYCRKYGALRIGKTTTLVIPPEAGENLMDTFLR